MNAFRKTLLAASLAAALPALCAAGEPAAAAPPESAQAQDLEKRLADARQRLQRSSAEVAELSRQLGRNNTLFVQRAGDPYAVYTPRALLGVDVDQRGQKDGAHVRGVSPGGAAAEAGIKAGDVIVSLAGYDLTKEADPGRALVEKMTQVEPNVKLQVGVLREGKKLTLDATPRQAPFVNFVAGPAQDMPRLVQQFQQRMSEERARDAERASREGQVVGGRVEIRSLREGPDDGTRFAGLEFATLSEKLGSYFGVKSGVLVVRAGGNAAFKLQDGDVILAVDGRESTSAQQAARILRSYSPGEKLRLRVQRDRRAQDLEITMPNEGREGVAIRTP